MKKVMLFAAVVTAFSFASCKKDYTCKCTTVYAGGSSPTVVSETGSYKATKKKSKTVCAGLESTDASQTTTCEAVVK